jgi:ADP-heptose:LPS heptosyltransferase
MPPAPERAGILALFPGALGDLLCCWPALAELRRVTGAPLTLGARTAWLDVLPEGEVAGWSIDRREVADLFASGPLRASTTALLGRFARIESWTGHGDPHFADRLRAASGADVAVHAFRDLRPGEHAADYYARCVGVTTRRERLPVRAAAADWAAALWERHRLGSEALALHPGSGGIRKNWEGMAAVAEAWRTHGRPVVVLRGPAESERASRLDGDVVVQGESLDRVAAVLARSARYLGNDSGISHLAAMVGARGVAVFGPTDARAWRPLGDGVAVVEGSDPCRRCGPERLCTHRVRVEAVLAALGV